MTRILCVWPDPATAALSGAVEQHVVTLLHGERDAYTSVTGPLEAGNVPGGAVSALYRTTVDMADASPMLHLFAVIPLYRAEALDELRVLAKEVVASPMPVSLCVVGLRGWLRSAVEDSSGSVSEPADAQERERVSEASEIVRTLTVPATLCVVDDFLANRAPVNFTHSTLAEFLAQFFTIAISHYSEVFNASVYAQADMVMGVGLAGISFPRRRCVNFLTHRAFKAALERVGIKENPVVDLAHANSLASGILGPLPDYFATYHKEHVRKPQDLGMSEKQITDEISQSLLTEADKLYEQVTGGLFAPAPGAEAPSLPQSEAILALILGEDDRYLQGSALNINVIFDDVFGAPLNVFLEASKAFTYTGKPSPLPKRGDYPALAYPAVGEDSDGNPIPDPRNHESYDPLPDIRRLRQDIIELSGWIRRSNKRVRNLEETIGKRRDADKVLQEDGRLVATVAHTFLGTGVEEVSLDEVYTPAQGLAVLPSVDLRGFLGAAVDQGEYPACTSFAVAAMYEALVGRRRQAGSNGASGALKLSEAFLYYHTPDRQNGSNFHDQIGILSTLGSCREELLPYIQGNFSRKPSPEAVADAHGHRLLQAKQITLSRTDRRFNDVEANHRLLTSALSEGYAVGISLRISEEFGSEGAYIGRPDDNVVESGKLYNHAMTIVGYDESAKLYIVRNSWGTDFGDKGYCYVSAAYIDDPTLLNFACIITATTDTETETVSAQSVVPHVAQIAGTALEIELLSLRSTIEWSRLRLGDLSEEFAASQKYFADLINYLSIPQMRRDLLERAENATKDARNYCLNKEREIRSNMEEFKRQLFRSFMPVCLTLAGISGVVASVIMSYLAGGIGRLTLYAGGAGFVAMLIFGLVFFFTYYEPKKVVEYKEEINSWASKAAEYERKLKGMKLEFFAAGSVMDMLKDVRSRIENTYVRLSSFVNNLMQWHGEYSVRTSSLDFADRPKERIVGDRGLIEDFFMKRCGNIASNFDFIKAFSNYNVHPEGLSLQREQMEEIAREAVEMEFDRYDLPSHLSGILAAPFLPALDMTQTMLELNRKAQVMLRSMGPQPSVTNIVIARHGDPSLWSRTIRTHFTHAPILINDGEKDAIRILSLGFIHPENML